jgi:tRNA(Ile)-lysidine synthase
MSLLEVVEHHCTQAGWEKTFWVGYSGGLDSHVLLHLFKTLSTMHPLHLRAIHIHHGLSPNADQWSAHCAQVCAQLQVELVMRQIKLPTQGNTEDAARMARYAAMQEFLQPEDILVTAHHQDDQAETLLLQLLRGSGPQGLAAMPERKMFGTGLHVRPLLAFTRRQLQDYAEEHDLQWINDESNTNTRFARNFIRHEVMPVIQQRWPEAARLMSRSAQHCAETQELLTEVSVRDLAAVQGETADTLSAIKVSSLSPARQRQLLRYWLQSLKLPLPNIHKIHQIQQEVLQSRPDASPVVSWAGAEVRRFRGELYAQPPQSKHDTQQIIAWDFPQALELPGLGTLMTAEVEGEGLMTGLNDITVRFRQGGETCRIAGRNCTHHLKKLLHAWQILPWERDRIPLIYVGDELAAAAGSQGSSLFVDEKFSAKAGQKGYAILMRRS